MIDGITLVAEVGINHNGSIPLAKQLIDACASAGCDFVKFQKRDIDSCYAPAELDAPRDSPWGTTNRQQKMGLEFSAAQYHELDDYCKQRGIDWFVSCWDLASIDLMEAEFPGMPYHKVASALLTDRSFLERLVQTGKPVVLSTGMSTEGQVLEACRTLGKSLDTVLHCTSTYPCPPELMNMGYLRDLPCILYDALSVEPRVGFSSHYSGLAWVPIAVAMGAKMLEFHVTLDRTLYGSDQSASLEMDGVRKLIDYVRVSSAMMRGDGKVVYESEKAIQKKLRKRSDF